MKRKQSTCKLDYIKKYPNRKIKKPFDFTELNNMFSMFYSNQIQDVIEDRQPLLKAINPTTTEEIWNALEYHRTNKERQKLRLLRHQTSLINNTNGTLGEQFYSDNIKECEILITDHNKEIEILRSKLSPDILELYDQEVVMLHLKKD